ncbi:transporter [Stutzerimonas frequens]|uniref:Urea transporter n=1 Tax=Stutzerimonas frequens TaxID=2968969 RepID=A0ABX6XUJ0_9GAMM|nr:urea transporter [Stutzerimonas frequens]MCQ4306136.1 urea transporter [Stutzerimonas frequens]PNF50357.1 transporter [Stutzerimonas frequens]QPT17692.1 urea transporter [Stutzerimonas frequens]
MPDPSQLRAVLHAFAQIFLQRHAGCGALIMLALASGAPAQLAGALCGVLVAHGGASWLGCSAADRNDGLYGYNAALLGALLVDLLGLTGTSLALVGVAALASCPLQAWLLARLRCGDGLPGFTLPFMLIGLLALLCIAPVSVSSPDVPAPDATTLRDAWLLGIGQVVFLDAPLAAACLLVAVALASLRDAFWLLTGSALGLLLAGPLGAPWSDGLAGFNPALAALALAQWRGGWRLPLLGMLAAVAIWRACIELGLPTLTLPFLLATWLGLTLRAPRPDRVE